MHLLGQFAQALEMAETIDDAYEKTHAFAEIAGNYAEIGQKNQANQILSQELERAETIESEFTKTSLLNIISTKYAEIGQFAQALELAERIVKPLPKDTTLAGIAGIIAEIEQQPGEKDMAELREVVHKLQPMRLLLE